ncbi:MAG: DNA repair protein RadC [Planctomycetota bacterium]
MDESSRRREKLRMLLGALTPIEAFSRARAREECSELSPQFVSITLKELVREGILDRYESESDETFRWQNVEVRVDPSHWIERQVRGGQVTAQPEHQRPREKLIAAGPDELSDGELLAVLIRVGVKGESAIEAGRRLAREFEGSVHELRKCGKEELRRISPAVTVSSYAAIQAGIELGRRAAFSEQTTRREQTEITSTTAAIAYCDEVFGRLAANAVQEEFHVVTLSTKHLPIHRHLITRGTLDASLVHPREVFRPAIRDSASAVILVHNHPSGDSTPSREDFQVTERLTEAGQLLGIQVLDHIVVASQGSTSIRETQ